MCTRPPWPIQTGTILDRIGDTPLVRIRRIAAHLPDVTIYAKAEWFNPGGSVKDRAAWNIVAHGIREGEVTPDRVIIDSTSGNTGIALAMIGAVLGYPVELVVPRNVSEERKKYILGYGTKIHYTDPLEGSDGALVACCEIVAENPARYFYVDQYNNPLNSQAHSATTAEEIWEQTSGRVTHFVAGMGTSGTVMGTGARLRELNPRIRVIGVEPDNALHGLEGLKKMEAAILPGIYRPEMLDAVLAVGTEESYEMVQRLASEEGLLVGFSSGAAMVGALRVAEEVREGVVVTVFPDGADKYLSTQAWHIPTG